jgi:NAD(P)H dehydrogenase (quinone)
MFSFFTKPTKKNIFIFVGQEDTQGTFCGALADAYEQGARAGGHDVRRTNIGDIRFDPLLHKGYRTIQELEPDLKKVQDDMRWANHITIIYPTWWSAMPAILKGFFDRTWLPGFAFHFHKSGMGWDALLKGRTGRIITTMDESPMLEGIMFGDSTSELDRAILKFSGIKPVRATRLGSVKKASDGEKKEWLQWATKIGKQGR